MVPATRIDYLVCRIKSLYTLLPCVAVNWYELISCFMLIIINNCLHDSLMNKAGRYLILIKENSNLIL